MHSDTIVIKLGESSLGKSKALSDNLQKIKRYISHLKSENKNIIILASALSGHSRKIRKIANSLKRNDTPQDNKIYNSLFCHGEFFSCNLIESYFNENDLRAQALIFEKTPIYLKYEPQQWRIDSINKSQVLECLKKGVTPIIPGFIGKSPVSGYQAMSFDSSDISAIKIAHMFNAQECVFLKNPGAIYTCNPKIIKTSDPIPQLDYEQLELLSKNTKPIVHQAAIELAQKLKVHIRLSSPNNPDISTQVHRDASLKHNVLAILYQEQDNELYKIVIVSNSKQVDNKKLKAWKSKLLSMYNNVSLNNACLELCNISKNDLSTYLKKIYQLLIS